MPVIAVYADGGVIRQNPSPLGGTWAACHVDERGERVWENSGVLLPSDTGTPFVTNNQTEFYALLKGLEATPYHWQGRACSDSQVTLLRFFRHGRLQNIPEEWAAQMCNVLRWVGHVEPILLDGHPTRAQLAAGTGKRGHPVSEHNVWCDKRCGEESARFLEACAAVLV